MQNKTMGLLSTIISLLFSLGGFVLSLFYIMILNTTEGKDGFIEGALGNPGTTVEQANAALDMFKVWMVILLIASILFIILEFVLLIIISSRKSSLKLIGTWFMVGAILHLITFRLVAAVLMLMTGLQARNELKQSTSPYEVDQTQVQY